MKDLITKALSNNSNLTMNAVAKVLGKNKATEGIKKVFDELLQANQIIADDSGRYTTYRLAGTGKTASSQDSTVLSPEIKTRNIPGYKITEETDGHSITTPNGTKINLDAGQRLLVIGTVAYKVRTMQDVISAIHKEAKTHTFVIKDVVASVEKGKDIYVTHKDIENNDSLIIIFEIRVQNKGGVIGLRRGCSIFLMNLRMVLSGKLFQGCDVKKK